MTIDRYGIVIGAQKAGTTTLFFELAGHPEVAPSSLKEPQFFASDERWARGRDWYESLWDWDPAHHRIAMEASPRYTQRGRFGDTASRMEEHGGSFRFVYLVRNPIDRIESAFRHGLSVGWGLAERPLDAPGPIDARLLDPCRYTWQLEPYVERFGRESILVRSFDDLASDRAGVVADVVDHWGLDPGLVGAAGDVIRNATADKVVSQRVFTTRQRFPRLVSAAKRLPPSWRQRAKRLLAEDVPPPAMPDHKRAEVVDVLRADLESLRDDWGIDVGRWDLGI